MGGSRREPATYSRARTVGEGELSHKLWICSKPREDKHLVVDGNLFKGSQPPTFCVFVLPRPTLFTLFDSTVATAPTMRTPRPLRTVYAKTLELPAKPITGPKQEGNSDAAWLKHDHVAT